MLAVARPTARPVTDRQVRRGKSSRRPHGRPAPAPGGAVFFFSLLAYTSRDGRSAPAPRGGGSPSFWGGGGGGGGGFSWKVDSRRPKLDLVMVAPGTAGGSGQATRRTGDVPQAVSGSARQLARGDRTVGRAGRTRRGDALESAVRTARPPRRMTRVDHLVPYTDFEPRASSCRPSHGPVANAFPPLGTNKHGDEPCREMTGRARVLVRDNPGYAHGSQQPLQPLVGRSDASTGASRRKPGRASRRGPAGEVEGGARRCGVKRASTTVEACPEVDIP